MGDPHLTYPEAIVIGLLQGVTELFPVSSLGHSVLVPAIIGGQWAKDLSLTADKSPYLTFLVAVHVATAVALVVFFRRDWVRIVVGLVTSIRDRRISNPDQRLAWLLLAATVPVGIAGIALDHAVRTSLGKPVPASVFLIVNGAVLATVERLRRRTASPAARPGPVPVPPPTGHYERGQVYAASSRHHTNDNRGVSAGHGGDTGSRTSPGARASSSALRRSSPCSPASAAPAPPWPRACGAACPTKTPPGSRSCSPLPSSQAPACSSFPSWPARKATASSARSSLAAWSPVSPPTCPCAS
jgi:Bacitracin resistance protein BacA